MKQNKIIIEKVLPFSIAEEAGIESGDILISINGEEIKDIFDYRFLMADEELVVEIQKNDGEIWEIEIEKDLYEDIGIDFGTSMLDEAKSCTNKCIFCFIDQLPEGMRDTLYFKDDDSRLSFLMGNYVTLTNMSDEDLDRIIKYKMSPINVSVHTTNPELRVSMLNNKFAGNVMERIKKISDTGITVNCQIVLCRSINDGDELERSIKDLSSLYPGVRSVSVVPVGITRHREGLAQLQPFDGVSSEAVIAQVGKWQELFLKKYGSRIVYLADEFYIMSNREIPAHNEYEDFPQIENGVGLIALLKSEFKEYLDELINKGLKDKGKRHVSIATGVSSYKYIKEMAETLEKNFNNVKISVFDIKNCFFGENVTVTGLLTGGDIVSQLSGKDLGERLFISRSMLKSGEDILLDDYTIGMIEEQLKVSVGVVENNGRDFIEKILNLAV